jgi:primosomal protein N' (replication factor Y)
MYYYRILVSSQRYRGQDALTYSSEVEIPPGMLVEVQLQNKQVGGIVVEATEKPSFVAKPISRVTTSLPLPLPSVELMRWLVEYYPAPASSIAAQFIPSGLLQTPRKPKTKPDSNRTLPVLPKLTREQHEVFTAIESTPAGSTVLVHGDTGSGKTRLYQELTSTVIDKGRDALILTPEISLTPQLVREFEQAFQGQVIIMHSGLTTAQRRDAWTKVLYATEPVIVIGPRSALFAPFKSLGLIVVDESHEAAYKQEQAPYYDARRVASKLASLHGALAVFGSATPSVSDYYVAKAKGAQVLRMTQLAVNDKVSKPDIKLVLARDKGHFTRHPYLSDELLEGVQKALNHGEQSLIFLNRRGTARLVLCQSCGWQMTCPNCDLPLTYHGDSHEMRCHTCGHHDRTPSRCPICASTDILFRSQGTKSVMEALEKIFAGARIQRFDTDNAKEDRFEQHYQAVAEGKVDILVGTQLLIKGLDLPKLSFVGVISADTALSFPDYTATERTYQLLTQVIGRIARGHRKGSAVIQTYQPDSPAIQSAITKNWDEFYEAEIRERQQFTFPPFCFLLKLTCARKTLKGAEKAADDLLLQLRLLKLPVQIIGPSPSFYGKTAGEYRWQLVIKAKNRGPLTNIIKQLPASWHYDIDPSNLL